MEDLDPTSLREAMEAPVTASLGPTGPLLRKLHSIDSGQLLLRDEIRPLKKLCISMKKLSEDEGASLTNRWWMKIVRELFYDAEDHLDEVCIAGGRHDFSQLLARVEDARRRQFRWSPPKASVSNLMSQMSFKLPVPSSRGVFSSSSSSKTVQAVEAPNKLIKVMVALQNDHKKTLKVIPISGCAGVGKTRLARFLYQKYGEKFKYRAFIIVSRNPDMRGVLTSMLLQLKAPRPRGFPNVLDLIGAINKHLQGKRYFIVIDDLWSASVWHIISRAFPRGDLHRRIIITTQMDDVALVCSGYYPDYIYKMEPLNDYESRKLFFGIVFGYENHWPAHMKEVSYEIIRKCGGLPLAIVNIASKLAVEKSIMMEKWRHIQDSLCSTSEGMNDVLELIYNSLPPGLRTCLLYVSMYPHGYMMKKEELVKHWVAEGLISAMNGRDAKEIAEGYFDELVSRAMIQAVDTNYNGEVLSCTVHHVALDFIRYKSIEENFVIPLDYFQSTLTLPDKVHRLSVQFGGVKSAYIPETIVTSKVRSLMFWGFFKCVPSSIMDCGFLRILILHIWADEDNEIFDLTGVRKLSLLKYFKIECNITVKLPDSIGMLQYLETLEVDARLFAVPSDIVDLERLLHLRLRSECTLPQEVACITSLHTLGYLDISRCSAENILHLVQLTNLQDLQLTCSTVQPADNLNTNNQFLGLILQTLRVLQSITLVSASVSSPQESVSIPSDDFSRVSLPPNLLLQRLELSRRCCIFLSLPGWFQELRKLCILKIAVRMLCMDDIEILKGLPALTALTLYLDTDHAENMVITEGGFPVLTYFKFLCAVPCLSFEQGAMPKLQKLNLGFNSQEWRSDTFETVGFSQLTGLMDVCIRLGVWSDDNLNIQAAVSALNLVLRNHPNSLIIRIKTAAVVFDGEEDASTTTTAEEEEGKGYEIREAKEIRSTGAGMSTSHIRPVPFSWWHHHRVQQGTGVKQPPRRGEIEAGFEPAISSATTAYETAVRSAIKAHTRHSSF